jgi:hypothetical protein
MGLSEAKVTSVMELAIAALRGLQSYGHEKF